MLSDVLTGRQDFQILDPVVRLVAVHVVDGVPSREGVEAYARENDPAGPTPDTDCR